jgi:hypothetical protein
VEVLGRLPGRPDRRLRTGRPGERHRPLARSLHDDGHRVHHDLLRRGAGHDAARGRVYPGTGLGPLPDGRGERQPHRGDGLGGPDPGGRPHQGSVRRRRRCRARAGRVHERGDPSGRDGRAVRGAADARRLRRHLPPHPGAREHPAHRGVPDGGLLLRRRPARAAGPAQPGARCPARRPGHGERPDAGREPGKGGGLEPGRDQVTGQRPVARRRAGCAARQPGPGRRGHQAARRRARLAHAHRARGGLRQLCADAGADRRPRARRDPGVGARVARRRASGRAGHARIRHAAHPQVPAGPRDQGHGADLRRADERDQLRRLRAARRARIVGGRSAGAGPQRRPDHAERG